MHLFKKHQHGEQDRERGQVLLMFVLFMIVLFVFVGLGIDVGFAYITKAQLSKAVDAACLAGMRNLSQGTLTAQAVADSTFQANYGRPGRDVANVTPDITWTLDDFNNRQLNVSATAQINTFFIRVLPQWHTLQVSANAQATRAKLIMTLVLDRSGSMGSSGGSGGGQYLPDSVIHFIDLFDDLNDWVAMASFASTATLDVPMKHSFKTDIINAADALRGHWAGGTFAQGGLTNALVQNNSVNVTPGDNVVKVAVFFTDGMANIIQSTFTNCPPQTLWNFGGHDSGSTVSFFNPTASSQDEVCHTSGGTPSCCTGVNRFQSAIDGTMKLFTRANVTPDAQFRSIQVANDMRTNNMTVYCVGLGDANVQETFLSQVANATNSPTFDATMPVGETFITNDPTKLDPLFQLLAQRILLRLTR